MPDEKNISLREFLELKIEHLKEIVELKELLIEKARQLQAVEYERRIGESNNHLAKLKEVYAQIKAENIPREVHDRDMKEVFGKIEVLTTSKDFSSGSKSTWTSVFAAIVAVAGILIAIFK